MIREKSDLISVFKTSENELIDLYEYSIEVDSLASERGAKRKHVCEGRNALYQTDQRKRLVKRGRWAKDTSPSMIHVHTMEVLTLMIVCVLIGQLLPMRGTERTPGIVSDWILLAYTEKPRWTRAYEAKVY